MRRIVVTGSECTGKTTLAQQLAARIGTTWAPEFARIRALSAGRPLEVGDVEPIARGQIAAEDAAAAGAAERDADVFVLDTDLVSTVVYARHYYGACPDWIVRAAHERRGDLYLLCAPDLPWTADGVRDRPERRDEIHGLFIAALAESGVEYGVIEGFGGQRFAVALELVTRDPRRCR